LHIISDIKSVTQSTNESLTCTTNATNSLPNWVVDVQSIDLFKVWLDRFWAQQEVMYDWKSELAKTGDRSEYVEKSD